MAIEKKKLTGKKTTPKKNALKVPQLTTKLKTATKLHNGLIH